MGIDLVDVARITRIAAEPIGLAGVLTGRELAYCRARGRPGEHMAGRFAAKEAVLKALGVGLRRGIRWTDVEVVNDAGGRPGVHLHGGAASLAAEHGLLRLEISISHTARLAVAHASAAWAGEPPTHRTDS